MTFWRRLFGRKNGSPQEGLYSLEFSGKVSLAQAMKIAASVEDYGGEVTKFDVKRAASAEYGSRVTTLGR